MSAKVINELNQVPLHEGVFVVGSNEDGLVALEKPTGVMSHPNSSEDIKHSLLQTSYDYQEEYYFMKDGTGEERRVWLINRLDSPTSGLILVGLNAEIARTIKLEFSTRKVTKIYHALVRHQPKRKGGKWEDTISKDLINNGRKIKGARMVRAVSTYQTIGKPVGGFPVALLKLSPLTGRTHQLRIQCKKHGHPIVGDRSYGHFAFNKEVALETGERRLMLHSSEVIVNYTYQGKVRTFRATSELPESFSRIMKFRPGMQPKAATPKPEKALRGQLPGRRFKAV